MASTRNRSSVSVVLPLLLLLLALVLTGADAAKKSDAKLPDCDQAGKLYKKGKLYDVLGLTKTATEKQIRTAFKKMSVKCECVCSLSSSL